MPVASRSPHELARRHAKRDRVTQQDIPQLFRWLQPASENAGGLDSTTPNSPASPSWEGLKESIPTCLRTYYQKSHRQGRMRQDTKRLAKIESVTKQLVEALELGASLDIAAAYAGIRPAEFREWLSLGHTRPRSLYGAFLGIIQSAIAKCDISDLKVVSEAAAGGEWKAALERLKLRGFGNQSSPEKKPVQVKIVNYNFNAPTKKAKVLELDYDTLEPVQEEVRAIENGEEPEGDVGECEDFNARGQTSKASSRNLLLGISEGETPSKTDEKEVTGRTI